MKEDGKLIPGCEQLVENIKRLVDGLAREIADRCTQDRGGEPDWMNEIVQKHARTVLLDWFLGDYVPSARPAEPI